MSLRRKTLLVLLAIIVSLMAILCMISWVVIKGNYQKLEKDEVRDQLAGGVNALSNTLENIDSSLKDWSNWDDTYAFVQDRNQDYIDLNLDGAALANLGINEVVFANKDGAVVYSISVDHEGKATESLPEGLSDHLEKGSLLLQPAVNGQGVKGVLVLKNGSLLIASEPIQTSKGEGPAEGSLIMGRWLDEGEIAALSSLSGRTLEVMPFYSDSLPADYLEAKTALESRGENLIKPVDSHLVAGYATITDIYGNPGLILKVESRREIYTHGIRLLTFFTLSLLGVCLILGIAAWLLLERLVISRVERLDREIAAVASSGSPGSRVEMAGKDELARLGTSINDMLERIEQAEERFRALIENALDIILILDRDARITYQSPSMANVLGYKAGELLGKDVTELVSEPDAEMAREGLRKIAASPGAVKHGEIRVRHADGSWRDIEATTCNLLEHPEIKGIVINGRDITMRRMMTDRLEKLNELFVNLGARFQENVLKIVFACRDILGLPLVIYYSRQAGKINTFSSDSEAGSRKTDPRSEAIADGIITGNLQEALIIPDIEAGEYPGLRRSMDDREINSLAAIPVIFKGKAIGLLAAFDFKDHVFSPDRMGLLRTLAHALLVEEERLDQEQKLKDFMDIASHELRHPITLMKGYALTLRDHGDVLDSENRSNYLEIINEAADRLDQLIRELLDISRMEQGRFLIHREKADVETLLKRAIEEMKVKGFGDRFSLSIDGPLSTREIDKEKMLRLLVILLDNAIIHSGDENAIEMEARDENGYLLVSVADRGTGIPEEFRERIFERFYQVEDALHHTSSGIGLGLYIARQIVAAHGGEIWCEGRPDGGSIFRFTVP